MQKAEIEIKKPQLTKAVEAFDLQLIVKVKANARCLSYLSQESSNPLG